jgi:hypothetical protein
MRLVNLQPQTAAIVVRTSGRDIGPRLVAARRVERPSCGGKAQLIDKGRWVSPLGPIGDASRLGVPAKTPFDVSGSKPESVRDREG